ncbi:hypothetical protein RclHR1_01440002 [Rhizophagus clarus]|uniref:Uncharacterized protein n=1 Tax=Rhizophagus clarus TaxID=94130 RepID=A0A2Z6QCL7_9GLOM|nr:hypothetical protein RclHR1_01440002 [Rhizophagus clarus]GES78275.1 hypothetical protein RCL_jg28473.t1 [Rhizophagus clarus]
MKKGFLLSKPAPKTALTSSTTQVTPTSAGESLLFDRFHDVIVDFLSGLIERNPELLSSIIAPDSSAMEKFLRNNKDQVVPMDKLSQHISRYDCYPPMAQFFATLLNHFLLDDERQAIILMDSEICQE